MSDLFPKKDPPKIDKNMYAVICYSIMMDDYMTKAPTYMTEKIAMLNAGLDAFAYLDIHNKKKVLLYLHHWRMQIPKEWDDNYLEELKAAHELGLFDD